MELLSVTVIGYFMGFGFGVGCALAVTHSIYTGGYRKAMEDSLREEKSTRCLQLLPKVQAKLARERAISSISDDRVSALDSFRSRPQLKISRTASAL
jgi:hypothetical protein